MVLQDFFYGAGIAGCLRFRLGHLNQWLYFCDNSADQPCLFLIIFSYRFLLKR